MGAAPQKTVVITGATSGFGKGLALKLGAAGHRLVLAARRRGLLEEVAAASGEAIAVPTDVSSEQQMRALATAAVDRFGSFDAWINNAGVGALGRFDAVPVRDHRRVVEVNLVGTMLGCHLAVQHFRERQSGTLVNVASFAGRISVPYYNSYGATKAAIEALGRSLRAELRLDGLDEVHVCTVSPLAADTPFFIHAGNYTGHELRPLPPIYDPETIIDVIAGLLEHPKDEVVVGNLGKLAAGANALLPGVTEKTMAQLAQKQQYELAPAAPDTSGSLHEPLAEGSGVRGGVKEQIARQDAQRH
ncbi:MAG TPA: SDR family NAD(P)-dependent oxidoreductase [Devosiaceae bacterium]|nr:SDR family NAD(P)-dependent oxidoreductase [Devosiaceae bacterium]